MPEIPPKIPSKILVIEDNEWSRDMLARRLSRRGYQVISAADGKRGIAMAHNQSPDLIVMDMSLPEIDGWEATRRLKADPSTRAIPILALTAHAMASDRQRAMDAGCDEYYTKPVDFESLVRAVEAFLEAGKIRELTGNIVPAGVPANAPADMRAGVRAGLGRNPARLGDPQ
jgi:two-component system cell cycle response regulator DivK